MRVFQPSHFALLLKVVEIGERAFLDGFGVFGFGDDAVGVACDHFGSDAKHVEMSMKMGELALLPAVRTAGANVTIVADGSSCRHQIADDAGRKVACGGRVGRVG